MALGVQVYGKKPVTKAPVGSFFSTKVAGEFDPTDGSTIPTTSTDDSSSGSNSGAYSYASALAKIAADQAAAVAATNRATSGAQYQADYLTGLLNQGIPSNLTGLLDQQRIDSNKYINSQYDTAMQQLANSYTGQGGTVANPTATSALGLTNTGYGALQSYLQNNAPTAYTNAPRATPGAVSNDLAAYMQAQGVGTDRANPGLVAANTALQGGAANYNALLGVLGANSAAGQESRLSEQQMAQTLAQAQLGAQNQQQQGLLNQQQQAALAQIVSEQAANRLNLERESTSRNQTVQDALATLLGSGYINPQQINPTTITGAAPTNTITQSVPKVIAPPPTPIQQLAAVPVKKTNTALNKRIESFVAANPNATAAQVKKKFPALGKNIK
jgi:DNA-binding TFAR19-related protein (PDSD5 family)